MNPAADNKKITVLSIGILVVLAMAVFVCWAATQPQALEPVKEITVTVAHSDEFVLELESLYGPEAAEERDPYVLEFETTARDLITAVEPYGVLEFYEQADDTGEYIPVVGAADGEYAEIYYGYAWLCYYNSEPLEDPLHTLEIEDGDRFYFYLDLDD